MTIRERFDSKWMHEPNSGCHIWTASCPAGYGQFKMNGKQLRAHRVAWEFEHGPIPNDLVLDHICKVRLCVNTSHLRKSLKQREALERQANERVSWGLIPVTVPSTVTVGK